MNPTSGNPQEAVQQLFVENTAHIRGFVFAFMRDMHRTNDIVQDVFLTATKKAHQFEPGTNFLAWVRAIARFRILQEWKRQAQDRDRCCLLEPSQIEQLAEVVAQLDDSRQERHAALERCLEKTSSRTRQILRLRFEENLGAPEIGARLSCEANAIRVALSRARNFLLFCVRRELSSKEAI